MLHVKALRRFGVDVKRDLMSGSTKQMVTYSFITCASLKCFLSEAILQECHNGGLIGHFG